MYSTRLPAIDPPAARPASLAVAQCSTRSERAITGWNTFATSPAAYTSGCELRKPSSTTMPFSTVRPAVSASSAFGREPIPTTTTSAGISSPSSIRTPVATPSLPSIATTELELRRSTPLARCSASNTIPISGPIAYCSGTASRPSTVTSLP